MGGDPPLAAGQVQSQLEKILASPLFCKAPRHSRFLTFVVHKTLAGEADAVKEYVIGLEVFDRSPGYDPGTDPIVRAEARRLRSRLAGYYREFGQQDPVHIELPKGTYVPVFHPNGVTVKPAIGEAHDSDSYPRAKIITERPPGPAVGPVPAAHANGSDVSPGSGSGDTDSGCGRIWNPQALCQESASLDGSDGVTNNVLVLAEFTNTTGDAVFDHTLRQGLSSQLEQSPFLNLLSDQRIAQTLSLMAQAEGHSADPRVSPRSLFAHGKRGQHRKLHLHPGQSVCAGTTGGELP